MEWGGMLGRERKDIVGAAPEYLTVVLALSNYYVFIIRKPLIMIKLIMFCLQ